MEERIRGPHEEFVEHVDGSTDVVITGRIIGRKAGVALESASVSLVSDPGGSFETVQATTLTERDGSFLLNGNLGWNAVIPEDESGQAMSSLDAEFHLRIGHGEQEEELLHFREIPINATQGCVIDLGEIEIAGQRSIRRVGQQSGKRDLEEAAR